MRVECKATDLMDAITHAAPARMRLEVKCPIWGTWLVRDRYEPIPLGKTPTDMSVAVHKHDYGWECKGCGKTIGTTKAQCVHIRVVRNEIGQ